MPEVATTAEEAAEKVERVMRAAGTLAGLVLFQTFIAVLIVDTPCFRLGESVVGFGDLNEFLGGAFVAAGGMKWHVRMRKKKDKCKDYV